MRKVLTVALVALLLFAATGVIALAEPPEEVEPGEKGNADPFHLDDDGDEPVEGIGEITPDNPIHVGE
ncbi:MAG: hypothetical protein ACLFN7_02695 [Candidatus Acetothermia bacterium]